MPEIDHERVRKAVPDEGESLDAAAIADLNRMETVAAICEVLDVPVEDDILSASDRVSHSTLRGILGGAVDARDNDDE